jgi:zinc protease
LYHSRSGTGSALYHSVEPYRDLEECRALPVNLLKLWIIVLLWNGPGGGLKADELSVKIPPGLLQDHEITAYSLPNGLKVLLYPDASAADVTVNVVYKTGAKHEHPGEYGMAHLLEHLAFQRTKNFPDIPAELKRRGARFNANTNADRTTYYETLPASLENLDWALAMEADRMTSADLSDGAIQKEWVMVKKEWEQSSRSGFQPLLKAMLQLAYPHHGYGRDTLGIEEGLHPQQGDRLRAFYARRYGPQLAVLSVGGRFVLDDARRLIEKYFASLPAGQGKAIEASVELRAQFSERLVIIPKAGGPAYAGLIYRAMPATDASYVAAQALVHCLSSGPESLLQKKFVRSGLAQEAFAFVQQSQDEAFLAFFIRAGSGRDPLRLVQSMAKLVETENINCRHKDIARFQKENEEAWVELKRDARALTMQLGEYEVLGSWRELAAEQLHSQGLQIEDLRTVARWLNRSNRTIGVFDPRTKHSVAGRSSFP